jgi:HK97 gp10 family phage protein
MTVKLQVDLKDIEEFSKALRRMPEDMRENIYNGLSEAARQTVVRARAYAPVRTGALRASIYAYLSKDLVLTFGAYVYYAMFVEYGTRYMMPRYFLTRAVQEQLPVFNFAIGEAVSQAWQNLKR